VALRDYLYISDTKVDMLLPQIDRSFDAQRTTEAGADLKFVNTRRTKVSSAGQNRILRVERVVRGLEKGGHVGTVEAPGKYFRGRLPVRWGPLADGGRDDSSAVFFGGRDGRTVVGLGGSATHVIGSPADSGNAPLFSPSLLPALVMALRRYADIETDGPDGASPEDGTALRAVLYAMGLLEGPAQVIEFVAKKLLHGPSPEPGTPDDRVLLGSPLYVALVD